MKKAIIFFTALLSFSVLFSYPYEDIDIRDTPYFYKGIYLNYTSSTKKNKLIEFINMAKVTSINVFVMDVQPSRNNECPIPEENIKLIKEAGIHPVARIVCFDQGLKQLPVSDKKIESIYALAESSAQRGFDEIQLDYIRFADQQYTIYYGKKVKLKAAQKYEFITTLIKGARSRVRPYGVKISADIFGRIPWIPKTRHDIIGQQMETFDQVVDVICPMAYPSHYWYDKGTGINYRNTPYETVYITSKKAKERTRKARIVSYIQSFELKIDGSGLSYAEYIEKQIDAVHDAEISGFILWNARQDYEVPFQVLRSYYMDKGI
jgi:hypothetical protein